MNIYSTVTAICFFILVGFGIKGCIDMTIEQSKIQKELDIELAKEGIVIKRLRY